ncbi:MAG: carboxyl transferase domain-containing protein [Pseudomonadales bacterium]|mgnify:CR=1 FL=1|jgi:acetyl-CoA carboxylase carboxyltransferase component|nr:acetyl-CoA carboxylase carboxyltransferase subunit [Gammaproteobacteria bacterium]MDP6314982.1 carboxyl transferase domain-containing protein [Pseudomonadales bacterium]MDP7314860.1 carboxyl transferase domain-containing protein [Pseudomonadales bacterium]MDP7451230.1 carboxyl transferase domain-containing protein [Arenicellales bacterium]|tara:strand:- start:33161 stop:34831 length:1671 start_codon:yes stop_codon:yes gene_type:complete
MQIIKSKLDTRSEEYQKNREEMLDELEYIEGLHTEAAQGGGEEAMERLRSRNKLPLRKRISLVLDRDSPFFEVSPLAAYNSNVKIGSGFIVGIGIIADTECVILGHDPSVRAGAFNAWNSKKLMRGLEIARVNRLPYVQFVESAGADLRGNAGGGGGGGGGQKEAGPPPKIKTRAGISHFGESGRLFYEITELSQMRIPTISVVFGASAAGGAYQPGMSDYNIFIKKQSKVFLGSPPLVKMATGEDADPEDLGGAEMHTQISGLGDYLAEDEHDGIRMCREVVAHLNWRKLGPGPTLPSDPPIHDPDELLGIVSRDLKAPFDMREVIARIVDGSRFEDFKPLYGPTIVCGWASIDGYPVGILGNNGPLMSESSEKATQFIQLCNQIDIPLLFLHNITGYIVGTDFEQGGITKNGSKMINAVANSTVPHISVIPAASYGAGNYGMSGRAYGTRFTFIWPTAKIAVMGPKQMAGVMTIVGREAAERRGLVFDEEADAKRVAAVEASAEEGSLALLSTAAISDDGLIDPRDTREHIAIALSVCHNNKIEGAKGFGVWRM